jgi:hypothetical protein
MLLRQIFRKIGILYLVFTGNNSQAHKAEAVCVDITSLYTSFGMLGFITQKERINVMLSRSQDLRIIVRDKGLATLGVKHGKVLRERAKMLNALLKDHDSRMAKITISNKILEFQSELVPENFVILDRQSNVVKRYRR